MASPFSRPRGRRLVISSKWSVSSASTSLMILLILFFIQINLNTAASSSANYDHHHHPRPGEQVSSKTGAPVDHLLGPVKLSPQTTLGRLIYDDNYMRQNLATRYPYLVQSNESYLGIRDYFDFDQVFWPKREYLEKLNIEQMLYEEMRAMEMTASPGSIDTWHYSDERQLAASGGHLANPGKCRASMAELKRQLEQAERDPNRLFEPGTRNMEFLRWIDSWGRPVSETYQGSSFWIGSYRSCRNLALDLNTSNRSTSQLPEMINFNYCWAKVAPRDWPLDDVMRPQMSVRVGVCLPDSCDTREARSLAPTILKMMHFNFGPLHRKRFTRLLDVYCLPVRPRRSNETLLGSLPLVGGLAQWASMIPTGARVFLLLFSLWLTLIGLCSLWEHFSPSDSATGKSDASWTRTLSFQENYRALTSDDAPPAGLRLDLRALGVPRLLASLLVVMGHCFINNYYYHFSPHLHIIEGRRLGYHLFSYSWKSLEIFFVLSGMLTSYKVLCKFAPKNQMHLIIRPRVWFTLNLLRFLRTAPLMMFIWTFVRTTFLYLGEGPYWDYGTSKQTFMGRCQQITWWRWLIYPIIADPQGHTGDPYQHECLAVSWYIVTDLKMFLVVPLYIYIIYTHPRWRWMTLISCVGVSTGWRYAHLHLQQLVHLRQIYTYGEMHAMHIFITFLDSAYYSPVDRFQALAMGLTAGLYLYKYKIGQLKRWPWWMGGKIPLVALASWLVVDMTRRLGHEIHFRQTGHIPSDGYIRAWMVLGPRLDALLFTLFALRLCTDWAPYIMRHTLVFYKLSKISYGIYVLHSLIIHYAVSSHERARPDTMAVQIFMLAAYVITLSFLIAFPLYLFVDSPITLLLNRIISPLDLPVKPILAGKQTTLSANSSSGPPKKTRRQRSPSVTDNHEATPGQVAAGVGAVAAVAAADKKVK